MTRFPLLVPFALLAATVFGAGRARAQLDSPDVILRIEDGALTTGAVASLPGGGQEVVPCRVFVVTLDANNFANDPGFDSPAGALQAGCVVGFDSLKALHVWNGSDFSAIATSRLQLKKGPLVALTPETDVVTPGLGLTVSAGGVYHNHSGMTLLPPASEGIYLLERRMWSRTQQGSSKGVSDSAAFWFVINQRRPVSEVEAAVQWVEDHLAVAPVLCLADIVSIGGLPPPDGLLSADDFLAFFGAYFAGDALADVASIGGLPPPDGLISADDFLAFFGAYFGGC